MDRNLFRQTLSTPASLVVAENESIDLVHELGNNVVQSKVLFEDKKGRTITLLQDGILLFTNYQEEPFTLKVGETKSLQECDVELLDSYRPSPVHFCGRPFVASHASPYVHSGQVLVQNLRFSSKEVSISLGAGKMRIQQSCSIMYEVLEDLAYVLYNDKLPASWTITFLLVATEQLKDDAWSVAP